MSESRDAVINLRGTNNFSPILQQAARDTGNLINNFRTFNAEGRNLATNVKSLAPAFQANVQSITAAGNALNQFKVQAQTTIQHIVKFNTEGRGLQQTMGSLTTSFNAGVTSMKSSGDALNGVMGQIRQNLIPMQQGIQRFNADGQALSRTIGSLSPAFRTFSGDLTTSRNAIGQMSTGFQQLTQESDRTGQGMGRLATFMGKFRGAIFGGTGLLTSGIEAVGMLQNLEMSAERVTEAQNELNRIVAEGGSGSREHAAALRELANANRAYNFQQRITFLSISDMIPFTLNLVNSLSNMGIKLSSVTKLVGNFTNAIRGLSIAMKGALIGTGVGAALIAIGLLMEAFSQKSEETAGTVSKAMQEIQKSSDNMNKEFDTDAKTMEDVLDRLERSTSINAVLIRQNIIDSIPTKEEMEGKTVTNVLDVFGLLGDKIAKGLAMLDVSPKPAVSGLEAVGDASLEAIASLEAMDQSMIPLTADLFELGAEGEALAATFGVTKKMTDEQAIQFLKLVNAMAKLNTPAERNSANFRSLQLELETLIEDINNGTGSLGPLATEIENVDQAALGLITTFGQGTLSFQDWYEAAAKNVEVERGFTAEADRQLKAINPIIDATKLSLEQKKELINLDLEGGDVLARYNQMLEDNSKKLDENSDGLEHWEETVTKGMEAMDAMSVSTLTAAQAAGVALKEFNTWNAESIDNIAITEELNKKLVKLATELGIDLPSGIKLTNEQLQTLIQSYRETGSAAGAMAEIHEAAFSEMHSMMDELVSAAKEGGKEWNEAWEGFKEGIPKGERGFFKDFVEDLGELEDANDTLFQTTSALDMFLDIYNGAMTEEQEENWSKKIIKDIKDLKDEADDLDSAAFNIDTLAAAAINMAKNADSGDEFRVLVNFLNDLHGAVDSKDADKIEQLRVQIGLLTGNLEALGNLKTDQGENTYSAEIEAGIDALGKLDQLPDTITMPEVVEPEGTDAILDKYRNKIQTLGSSGGGGGGPESMADEIAGGSEDGGNLFSPVVMPAPDFETEFTPGLQAGVDLVAEFNSSIQEELSALWEAGIEIFADFNSSIQEELSALWEAGIEIMADFNISVQEEISAMHQFGTEVTEDMISTMQDSFDSLDTGDAVDAIEELEDAIDNLKSKTVTVTVKVKREGGSGGGSSGGGGAGRQHGGLDMVLKPTDFTMGEHHLPEIVQVVKAGGRSLYEDLGGDVNRLVNRSRKGNNVGTQIEAMRSEYMSRLQNMITRLVRNITSRAVHVTVMTPDRKVLADEVIYNLNDNIGAYKGR